MTKAELERANAQLERALKREQTARKQADAARERLKTERDEALQRLTASERARAEALEQQTATSAILRVISGSPTDVQPVLDAIVQSAVPLCDGSFSAAFLYDGALVRMVAHHNFGAKALAAFQQRFPQAPNPDTVVGRAILDGQLVHVDHEEEPDRFPVTRDVGRAFGYRTIVAVPMLRDVHCIGTINVARAGGAFTDRQLRMLQTFADQAVIAIENVRLFTELAARNRELTEALDQQTATSEVLRAIATAPTELRSIFQTICESAMRLVDAWGVGIYRFDGHLVHLEALTIPNPDAVERWQQAFPHPLDSDLSLGDRAITEKRIIHVPDTEDDASERLRARARDFGYRRNLAVPLLRDGGAIGVITVAGREAGPFSERQIDVLRTFADQAVVAIENVRLFTELQEKNCALTDANAQVTEALDQQTATADILRVIASSPTDEQPVFEAIVQSALRLLDGHSATVARVVGEEIHLVALTGTSAAGEQEVRALYPRPLSGSGGHEVAIRERTLQVVTDTETDPRVPPPARVMARARGFRSSVNVPMVRDGVPIGSISVTRREPGRFTEVELRLLQTFADQAVIAIENVRLFTELQEKNRSLTDALAQQMATADVLRIISSSPTAVQPVFETIVRSAARLCDASFAGVMRLDSDGGHVVAAENMTAVQREFFDRVSPYVPDRDTAIGISILEGRTIHLEDVLAEAQTALRRATYEALGNRTFLSVPILKDGRAIGAIFIWRIEHAPFSDSQIELVKTFADQAVIAIENVRLFTELQEKNRALTDALDQQTATSDILRAISSSPTDVNPVFEAIADNAARLLGVTVSAVFRFDGEQLHYMTGRSPKSGAAERFRSAGFPMRIDPASSTGRVLYHGEIRHIVDVEADPAEPAASRERARIAGYRCLLNVPMVKDRGVVGMLGVGRPEPVAFTDAQIELFKTFADQAVIAIENVRLFTELEQKNRALTEALDQQTATSEILRVVASSPADLRPVFEAISRSATHLCRADFGGVVTYDGAQVHIAARTGLTSEESRALDELFPYRPTPDAAGVSRAILRRELVHIPDVRADIAWQRQRGQTPAVLNFVEGFRAAVFVPLLRDDQALGAIALWRRQPGAFSEEQIVLLQTFADQAVIAIENARLFTELQDRNREIAEAHAKVTVALEQQTATSEILSVISSSPTDTQPVFDAIVRSAVSLCDGLLGTVLRVEGDRLDLVAHYNVSREGVQAYREAYPMPIGRETVAGNAILDRRVIHVIDAQDEAAVPPRSVALARAAGFRGVVAVPLLRAGEPIGLINVARRDRGPFSDRQIELIQTFANQAVIAIENARLFTELQEKNGALTDAHAQVTEALDRQTATGDILRVISETRTDVQPVFEAIAASAHRLCGAWSTAVWRVENNLIRVAAAYGGAPGSDDYIRAWRPVTVEAAAGFITTALVERRVTEIADVETDVAVPESTRQLARVRGWRSILVVPMVRGDQAIGHITVTRAQPGRFAAAQIDLLKTFADQAVIAIENVRLLTELQQRTNELIHSVDQLTALGEVSRAVSSTLDLDRVLNTVIGRAAQLAGADGCSIFEYDDHAQGFRMRATSQVQPAQRTAIIPAGEGAVGRLTETRAPVQIPDISSEEAYRSPLRDALIAGGYRALLAVPMIQEDAVVGGLVVSRKAPGEFPAETVDLLQTFANQSALAIANARLFREIEEKSAQLQVANQHKSEFLANMSHELRTPLNAVIGFSDVLLEGMFGEINEKQAEYLRDILSSGKHLLSLINDILDLSKIEAGRMELDLSEFDIPQAISDALLLMRERAQRHGIALGQVIDERLGAVTADERKFKQVLLNLLSNAVKFTAAGGKVEVRAQLVESMVEVAVTDTGEGIAAEDQAAVFEEFRQVGKSAKKVEGTGLGLALCRKFVELHGGAITVESQVGVGSTFTFTIPSRLAPH